MLTQVYNHGVYEFDDSRRPLVVVRMRGQARSDVASRLRADLDALVDGCEPYAIIFDISDIEIPPREEVMDVVRWTRELRDRHVRNFEDVIPRIPTFTAYHMPSMVGNLLRFVLQMMPSIRNQHVVCTSFEQAVAACEEAIVRLGIDQRPSRQAG